MIEISKTDPHAVVLFHDAYDVLYSAGPEAILEAYFASGARMLVAGERGCAPYTDGRPEVRRIRSPG